MLKQEEIKKEDGWISEEEPRGSFNLDVLLNTKFTDTKEFSVAANHKIKFGVYCDAAFKSKRYNDFWTEEKRRCLEGYVNPKTGVRITGYHYFFLNFKQLESTVKIGERTADKETTFPKFWAIHYHFFHALEEAKKAGKHICLLKPRGTGFSELFSSMGACTYTMKKKKKSFYFVSHKDFLNKDGIITKAWDNLEYLNSETERAFRHLRQGKNQDLHKRASVINPRTGNEKYTGGEIVGKVIDDPNKVRGARGDVFMEEGGSFPKVDLAWNMTRPLVEQGGYATSMIMLWGTGGEQGPGIAGLDEIFRNPDGFNCLAFDNCWEESLGKPHGFFFPTWACMDKYMDEDGNPDFEAGRIHHEKERARIHRHSPQKEDKYIAEYPFTPNEALMRLSFNDFPVAELQKQLDYVETNTDIQGFLKYGDLNRDVDGKLQFEIDPHAVPVDIYPHKDGDDVKGCVTILESPLKDQNGYIPDNLYQIVVDPYYKDEATDSPSLGAVYVYKKKNTIFDTEDDMLVAWYVGRPRTTTVIHRTIFNLAEFYNAKVQSEIAGGGKGLLDYAKVNNKLKYCDFEPSMFTSNKEVIKLNNRSYFINMPGELKRQCITDLADWLLKPRNLKIGNEGEETEYILNLHKIYDKGLLQELIKFSDSGNFDRVSAMLVLMVIRQEIEATAIKTSQKRQSSFYRRPLFTDYYVNNDHIIPASELMQGSDMEKISKGESII